MDERRARILSIQPNTIVNDRALFTLGPVGCILDMWDIHSRGFPGELKAGASYRLRWSSQQDSGFLFSVSIASGGYKVSWSRTNAAPSCPIL